MSNNIKAVFDDYSVDYDRQRRQLIPCFEDFYRVPLLVAPIIPPNPRILDIGAGTGLFSWYFLQEMPEARITLMDFSGKMLEIAQTRLKEYKQTRYIVGDYTSGGFAEQYDCIISSLSIHHLSDPDKTALFEKCYEHLAPGGFFINADQVLGSSPFWDELNKKMWRESIERSGLSPEEIQATYQRVELDREATMDSQMKWLREAGFIDVDCIYKYGHFAVIIGRKPS